ncbi:fructose-specific PTS transporter subunit EIIC [Streptomyces malaysiensis]|uniref:PTS system fructose subfamily transporter subunit IIC n=1 Tax=Streptomyces malaysiensis TaxID=92644 RepID=A0A7X6AXS8_STRMQ|nr:fructose-specific PTS transporter subunit EIIC [Streptomyces malaysiensis]NIY66035.1 PTS system fructose subfamily transporter subunit IIC [Streptomyces malaysiensis]
MTSPADPPNGAGASGPGLKLLAVTACPTGIAHTYMAAEKLAQAAESLGHSMKVETQGSIGAENVLSDNDVSEADGIIIAADKDVDRGRFVGKRVLVVGVADGIHRPERLIEQVLDAPVYEGDGQDAGRGAASAGRGSGGGGGRAGGGAGGGSGKGRSVTYKALMNGVSYMIPFVVVGGLLIAVSLALGGDTTSKGIVIPDDSFWKTVNDIGSIGFELMIPALSGYIAYAIADRPALVPGMVGGWIAAHGDLYDSEAGAGFIGAIVTGFLAGYLVLWIKRIRVPKFVQPIMPIIVIPIVATSALGLFFIYVLGEPISWVFENLTDWLGGLTGTSAALLGIILGLMIAFDMGGPVNKTAFLFGAGLVSKNPEVMGACAAAIPVPPLGQGLATLLRRRMFDDQERETGLAALFMGFFGITEGAIPFAAARPARVIPANMLGGAVAGAIAGVASVEDNVPHGGPIVAVLGAIGAVPMFFVAVVGGTAVTALVTIALMSVGEGRGGAADADADAAGAVGAADAAGAASVGLPAAGEPVLAGVGGGGAGGGGAPGASGVGVASVAASGAGASDAGAVRKAVGSEAGSVGGGEERGTAGEAGAEATEGAAAVEDAADAGSARQVLSGYLTERTVKQRLAADGKDAAIREMAELLAATGKVVDTAELVRAAFAREDQGTTGLGEEIAIPHAKTDAVTAPVVGFARSPEGIEWGAPDGTKARLVFMIAVPEAAAGDEHLRILALLSRKLMGAEFRERLLGAGDVGAILGVLGEIE